MNHFLRWYKGKLASVNGSSAITLLVFRLIAGSAFVIHGWGKMQAPMSWMGEGASTPGFFQLLAAVSEFGGGIAWILGLAFPLASFGILCTMTVALFTHMSRGDAFIGHPVSYETPALYWGLALFLLFNGPGRLSVDRKLVR